MEGSCRTASRRAAGLARRPGPEPSTKAIYQTRFPPSPGETGGYGMGTLRRDPYPEEVGLPPIEGDPRTTLDYPAPGGLRSRQFFAQPYNTL